MRRFTCADDTCAEAIPPVSCRHSAGTICLTPSAHPLPPSHVYTLAYNHAQQWTCTHTTHVSTGTYALIHAHGSSRPFLCAQRPMRLQWGRVRLRGAAACLTAVCCAGRVYVRSWSARLQRRWSQGRRACQPPTPKQAPSTCECCARGRVGGRGGQELQHLRVCDCTCMCELLCMRVCTMRRPQGASCWPAADQAPLHLCIHLGTPDAMCGQPFACASRRQLCACHAVCSTITIPATALCMPFAVCSTITILATALCMPCSVLHHYHPGDNFAHAMQCAQPLPSRQQLCACHMQCAQPLPSRRQLWRDGMPQGEAPPCHRCVHMFPCVWALCGWVLWRGVLARIRACSWAAAQASMQACVRACLWLGVKGLPDIALMP